MKKRVTRVEYGWYGGEKGTVEIRTKRKRNREFVTCERCLRVAKRFLDTEANIFIADDVCQSRSRSHFILKLTDI